VVRDTAKFYVGFGGLTAIAGSLIVVLGHITELSDHIEYVFNRKRRHYKQRDTDLILDKTTATWRREYIPSDVIDKYGYKKSIREAINMMAAELSVCMNVSPEIHITIPTFSSCSFKTKIVKRNLYNLTATRKATSLFKEYIDTAHKYYPRFDWINNSGCVSPKHIQALVGHGPSPEHRIIFLNRLPYWVHQRIIKDGVSAFPKYFWENKTYIKGPTWWSRYFDKPFYLMGPVTYLYDIENVYTSYLENISRSISTPPPVRREVPRSLSAAEAILPD
jgi:ribonuclease HII